MRIVKAQPKIHIDTRERRVHRRRKIEGGSQGIVFNTDIIYFLIEILSFIMGGLLSREMR